MAGRPNIHTLGMGSRPISLSAGQRPTEATTGRWSERMVTHTGTETLPRLLREAAVENLPQWEPLSPGTMMTVPGKEATANHVPAAAVTRGWRALFGFTGRKGSAGGPARPP